MNLQKRQFSSISSVISARQARNDDHRNDSKARRKQTIKTDENKQQRS
jgi:hypothetical protein